MAMTDIFADLSAALAPHGMMTRGAIHEQGRTIILIGHAGSSFWPHFTAWRKNQPENLENPLDAWSREVLEALAAQFGARAVSPSDRPYLPFQQWAMRAEGLKPSPLGILMHPQYGLWQAYRGALIFDAEIPIQAPQKVSHACDACAEKPCLSACPVSAYSAVGFDAQACVSHASAPQGAVCRQTGCLARNACPAGAAIRYDGGQQAFHMAAFLAARD